MKYYYFVVFIAVIALDCETKEPISIQEVSMPILVKDVTAGELLYENKNIKIRGIVKKKNKANLELLTNHPE